MATKAIDPQNLRGYEFDGTALRRFDQRYIFAGVIGATSLVAAFLLFCVFPDAKQKLGDYSGFIFLGLGILAAAFSVVSYLGPVRCSRCGRLMTKYNDQTIDRESAYGHVYVCEHCKLYFSRKVVIAA